MKVKTFFVCALFATFFVPVESCRKGDKVALAPEKKTTLPDEHLGLLHNKVLNQAKAFADSLLSMSSEKRSESHFNIAGSGDPLVLSHDITLNELLIPETDLFSPQTEQLIAQQVAQLNEEAISSGLMARPNEVVNQLLHSAAFKSLSARERGYFLRLTSLFKTNDYAAIDQLLKNESVRFAHENWSGDEGQFVEGFISIAQASLQFWKDVAMDPSLPPLEWNEAWLQVDGAGYLYGWFKSWAIDEEPVGRIRIKNGLLTAAEWSTIRYFSRHGLRQLWSEDWRNPFINVPALDPNAVFVFHE